MIYLKPCPFCGSKVTIEKKPMGLVEVEHIEESDCILNVMGSQWWGDIQMFIDAWNRRVGE